MEIGINEKITIGGKSITPLTSTIRNKVYKLIFNFNQKNNRTYAHVHRCERLVAYNVKLCEVVKNKNLMLKSIKKVGFPYFFIYI